MSSNKGFSVQKTPTDDVCVPQPRQGKILEVVVDLRRRSPSSRKRIALRISGENRSIIWVPAGLAHGFRVPSETAHVFYTTADDYALDFERTLAWTNPDLKIDGESDGDRFCRPKTSAGWLCRRHGLLPSALEPVS